MSRFQDGICQRVRVVGEVVFLRLCDVSPPRNLTTRFSRVAGVKDSFTGKTRRNCTKHREGETLAASGARSVSPFKWRFCALRCALFAEEAGKER